MLRPASDTEYRRWHADIKPENILRVYGEFKLADFGFATFSDRNWGGNTPTSFIDGGTATFGEWPTIAGLTSPCPWPDASKVLQKPIASDEGVGRSLQ